MPYWTAIMQELTDAVQVAVAAAVSTRGSDEHVGRRSDCELSGDLDIDPDAEGA